jgi:hypothetical protein
VWALHRWLHRVAVSRWVECRLVKPNWNSAETKKRLKSLQVKRRIRSSPLCIRTEADVLLRPPWFVCVFKSRNSVFTSKNVFINWEISLFLFLLLVLAFTPTKVWSCGPLEGFEFNDCLRMRECWVH